MTGVEWRPIAGTPGYEVSSDGQVRSWKAWRGLPIPHLRKPVPMKRGGYLNVMLRDEHGRPATRKIHVLVAEAFIGPRPIGQDIRHLDGNKLNNAAANIAYGTRSENNLDILRHGTHHFASRDACKQGHPFDEANTRIRSTANGFRRDCRECRRLDSARRAAERKAARAAAREAGAA